MSGILIKLEVSIPELRNIAQGLDLVHTKCMQQLSQIPARDPTSLNCKEYFKAKQGEVIKQITEINKILNGNYV
jgi:hypothetical protein